MSAEQMSIGEMLAATVPMVRTLDLTFGEVTAERAVAHLPDQAAYHNHVGGPHAGAMFTLAESARGGSLRAPRGRPHSPARPRPPPAGAPAGGAWALRRGPRAVFYTNRGGGLPPLRVRAARGRNGATAAPAPLGSPNFLLVTAS
ncbi:PaaI family thioesterase [Streptomyces albidoflavus]